MHRIALLALLMSVSSTAFADAPRAGAFNGTTNDATINGATLNGLSAHRTVLNVEGPTGMKAPHASARNGRLFVR